MCIKQYHESLLIKLFDYLLSIQTKHAFETIALSLSRVLSLQYFSPSRFNNLQP